MDIKHLLLHHIVSIDSYFIDFMIVPVHAF